MIPITILPGDGIGPEIMDAALKVLQATGLGFEFQTFNRFGEASNGVLEHEILMAIADTKVALKGPTTTKDGNRSLNVQLREQLVLFANIRPVISIPGITTRYSDDDIDTRLYRENLGDLYVGREYVRPDGVIIAEAEFDPDKIERFARFAYADAARLGRKRMTIVTKHNILPLSHGTFLRIAQEVGRDYPGIVTDEYIVDNALHQLIAHPERFDSILTTNLFGDIFSDGIAAFVGSLGLAPGANIGDEYAVFEAVHGTAPDIAGKGIANPTSLILSAAMMLDHLGEHPAARCVRHSVLDLIEEGEFVTADINPHSPCSTSEFADAVARRIWDS